MTGDASKPKHDATMLDGAIRIEQASSYGTDTGPHSIESHLLQPGSVDHGDIVVQE